MKGFKISDKGMKRVAQSVKGQGDSYVEWQDLEVYDDEGNYADNLGSFVGNAPANLDDALIEDGVLYELPNWFIAAPGEEPDEDTPRDYVDWTGFEETLRKVRGRAFR